MNNQWSLFYNIEFKQHNNVGKLILNDNQKIEILDYLNTKGELKEDILKEWEIVEEVELSITSTPDEKSTADRGKDTRIRYEYVGPQDSKNRSFCANVMSKNKLYRREDIDSATNSEFGNYNIFKYSGSFNCRHNWQSVILRRKKDNQGNPIDAPITDGVVKDRILIDIDKRNEATIKKAGDEPDFILNIN